ncbi:hypothetical protein ACIBKZ_20135 [Streptomyces sp. NPDC050421]|uniref:hypothetical protein n=1 Tax=unclassified Streptomyces TaxID=2593676 RepID=UPI00379E2220
MTGAEFIARTISTGSLLGARTGDGLDGLASVTPFPYVDDLTGRRDSRILRRDYGLFEVTCGGEPDWVCLSFSLEVHRLLRLPELREEVREQLGVRFEPFTNWADVRREHARIPGSGDLEVLDGTAGYRAFRERSTGTTVQVVHDPSAGREEFPGHGDVWSVDLISPRFLR